MCASVQGVQERTCGSAATDKALSRCSDNKQISARSALPGDNAKNACDGRG